MTKKDFKIIPVEKANDFVGIRINKDIVEIFVPQVFREENDKQKKKDIVLFLKSLSVAKSIENESIKMNKDDFGSFWPIDSYLWIIKDYLENGYYYNRERKNSSDNKGKINWKRTMKSTPIISNGNIIYDKLITSKMSSINDIITDIYKLCLKHAINKIGWLFDYNMFVDVTQKKSNKEMEYIVAKEINSTFDDIKKLRFKHMLKILENVEGDNALSNNYSYGITNYYYVFEQMVDIFFKGIRGNEKKKYNPSGYWQLNKSTPIEASLLRPDTVYKRNDEVFIIDAKMYQYGATHDIKDLPQTESMQKQITYGDFVRKSLGDAKVRNAFIFPYNKYLDEFVEDSTLIRFNDSNLVYFGKAYVDWRNQQIDHDYIYSFMIDFNFLLRNYKIDDSSYINTVCDYINQCINVNKL